MKRSIIVIGIIVICFVQLDAQQFGRHQKSKRHRSKIEQLEKIKLMEVLDLDEETSVRFFARYRTYKDNEINLMDSRDSILQIIKNKLDGIETKNENYLDLISKISHIETRIVNRRTEFLKSVQDILTPNKIAQFIVFNVKFREELRRMLINRNRMGRRNK